MWNTVINALAAALGVTPEQAIMMLFSAVMSPVTFWVTKQVKDLLAKIGWFTTEVQDQISGKVMVFVSSLVSVVVVLLVGWVFGIDYLSQEDTAMGIVVALGVNQTLAQVIFHTIKDKAKKPAA